MLSKHTSLCRVYKTRLGRVIDTFTEPITGEIKKIVCIERVKDSRLFDDCPFNPLIKTKLGDTVQ